VRPNGLRVSCAALSIGKAVELIPAFKKAASLGPRSGVTATRLLGRPRTMLIIGKR